MKRENVFVGRDAERELLQEYMRRAVAGDQQLVLIEGETGTGKTALLQAFAREHAGNRSVRLIYLSAPEVETYRPVHHAALAATDQRLYARVGGRRQAREVARDLGMEWAGTLPVIGDILAAVLATVDRLHRRRSQGFLPEVRSVDEDIDALISAAKRKPLIFLLDDLERADAGEIARLEKLIMVADEGANILIVGAFRSSAPGEPPPPVRRLFRTLPDADEYFVHRRLGAISPDELAELLAKRFPGVSAPPPFVERFFAATGGHPGAIEDVIAHLQLRRRIWRQLTGWHIDFDADIPVLRGSERSTFDLAGLPDHVVEVVRAASLLGSEFDGSTLARLLDADELEVEDRLAAAIHFGLLESSGEDVLSSGDVISHFRFASPHVVPMIREGIPAERRESLETRRQALAT